MPVVDEALRLAGKFMDDREGERQLLIKLIDRTKNDDLVDRLISQYLDSNEMHLENRRWWQLRFRALGDVFDGDAWERIVAAAREMGYDNPGPLPVPPPVPEPEEE